MFFGDCFIVYFISVGYIGYYFCDRGVDLVSFSYDDVLCVIRCY